MKKETFNLIIRFMVGLAVSLLLCAGMIMTGRIGSSKPLIQQASGLNGDEVVMTVDGEEVAAWEYLYMTSYVAQNLSYYGITDLTTELSEGYTAADYVAEQAESQVVQQAAIRKWAADLGLTLTEEDQATIQAQKDAYGDELDMVLQLNGMTGEQFDQLMSTSLLYNQIYSAYCGENGALCPDETELLAEAEEHGLMTADVLSVSTSDMDDAAVAEVRALLEGYAAQLSAAGDKDAAFAALELDERVTATAGATYDGCEETALNTALAALEQDAVSAVIEDEGVLHVVVRRAVDLTAVAEVFFSEELTTRIVDAEVVHNDSVYSRIDVAAYYAKFSSAQQALYTKLMSAGE